MFECVPLTLFYHDYYGVTSSQKKNKKTKITNFFFTYAKTQLYFLRYNLTYVLRAFQKRKEINYVRQIKHYYLKWKWTGLIKVFANSNENFCLPEHFNNDNLSEEPHQYK